MGCCNSSKKENDFSFYKTYYTRTGEDLKFRPIFLRKGSITDDYELGEVLGSGSFGEVKKGKHLLT